MLCILPLFVYYFESDGAPALLTLVLVRNVPTVVRTVLPKKRRSERSSTMAGELDKSLTLSTSLDFVSAVVVVLESVAEICLATSGK